jgi:hypothetical protein
METCTKHVSKKRYSKSFVNLTPGVPIAELRIRPKHVLVRRRGTVTVMQVRIVIVHL